MLGQIKAEFTCTPRDNDEYRRIRAAKEEAEKAKHSKYTLISGAEAAILHTKSMKDHQFDTGAAKLDRKKAQENKATRMDENELIDALAGLFRKFRFWPLASLKKELNQPADYLKQTLQKIGTLIKTGQAANHWTLNDTYLESLKLGDELRLRRFKEESDQKFKSEEFAPEAEDADGDLSMGEEGDDGDDDDDDEVFEDAV
jgi:transcription initiation factor TFIIF subunit beta